MSTESFTTGDIARAVGCNDLTVRRYLADKGVQKPKGSQYRFNERQFQAIVKRLNTGKVLYGKHLRRYERPVNGQLRMFMF